ncbi:MAG TPA: DapH/DapD/GlmU-related protein [Ktedonobacterales bacterium]|nr:DapH/DapD/GlmU-related protein [Ktedonobacterales bacterium]
MISSSLPAQIAAALAPHAANFVQMDEPAELDPYVLIGQRPRRSVGSWTLRLGAEARLGSGTILYLGSSIGARFQTGHHVVIREQNTLGDDVSVWSNSVVDYGCQIGCRVKIHTNVYVAQFSTLEDEVFLAPGVSCANDLHPGCPMSTPCMRGPTIKKGAQLGVNVTVLPYVVIGEHAVIGAGSVVTQHIPARAVAYGNPARVVGTIDQLVCSKGFLERPYAHLEKNLDNSLGEISETGNQTGRFATPISNHSQ